MPNGHVLGWDSDLSLVIKQGLFISANNVLFVRLIRVKASEEQGLSLFPDKETFSTCPVHAIAVALLMQSAPCISLLPQLTTKINVSDPASTVSIPLVELLDGGCHVEAGIIKETTSGLANTRAPGVIAT